MPQVRPDDIGDRLPWIPSRAATTGAAWAWGIFCAISMLAVILAGIFLEGCGGGWSDADTKSASDAAHAQLAVEQICSLDDAECKPSQVRALERMSYCANASMLAHHGIDPPKGSITCQAK